MTTLAQHIFALIAILILIGIAVTYADPPADCGRTPVWMETATTKAELARLAALCWDSGYQSEHGSNRHIEAYRDVHPLIQVYCYD